MTIALLGASGYVGQAFQKLFKQTNTNYVTFTYSDIPYIYNDAQTLAKAIKLLNPSFVINSAGYTGKPNVDACETDKANCLIGNVILPGVVAEACNLLQVPFGHVSSGCIYQGRRPIDNQPFTELDKPNFCFGSEAKSSFYSGCKALGEEVIAEATAANGYIWRLRVPFNNSDNPRNYITKLITYSKVLEVENSLSNLDEFVNACWQSFVRGIPFGTYNVTNPGGVFTSEVCELIEKYGLRRNFEFFADLNEFYATAAKTPRSSCVLDCSKLLATGIHMTPVIESIDDVLRNWESV